VSFVVAGCVLRVALIVGAIFDAGDELGENDPAGPYSQWRKSAGRAVARFEGFIDA
jgi:hypothetical protein